MFVSKSLKSQPLMKCHKPQNLLKLHWRVEFHTSALHLRVSGECMMITCGGGHSCADQCGAVHALGHILLDTISW